MTPAVGLRLWKSTDFPLFDPLCRFTDDTVLTVATAYCVEISESNDNPAT